MTIEDLEVPDGSLYVVMAQSILHLLEDKETAIAKVLRRLKPDGAFVTSTICLADSMNCFRYIAPIGHFLGVLPLVRFFTAAGLESALTDAGFEIDDNWQPGPDKAIFLIGKNPARA